MLVLTYSAYEFEIPATICVNAVGTFDLFSSCVRWMIIIKK